MRPSRTIRFFGLAVVVIVALAAIGWAQVPSKPNAPAATTHLSPRQHPPMRFHRLRSDGTVESENWSGYAVTGSSFTRVEGSWIVPTVNCSITPGTYSAFWVGLDGYSSSTVEQIGTDSDCDGDTPAYYAWYEFYPKFPKSISLSVSPGDKMSAQVSYNGAEFTITITNDTTGQSFSQSSKLPQAKRSSAEWIAEAPSSGLLSDFGAVSFGEDYNKSKLAVGTNYATDSSTSGPISSFGSATEEITMVNSKGADEAVPTSLTPDGTSFKVTWISQ